MSDATMEQPDTIHVTAIDGAPDQPAALQAILGDIAKAKADLRAAAANIEDTARHDWARSVCIHAVSAYWVAMQTGADPLELPDIPDGVRLIQIDKELLERARWIGRQAAGLDAVAAGYAIGTVYTATLPDGYRRSCGSYYTPPALTARLIALATEAGVDWKTCTVLDPACGGGAFLGPVALRMLEAIDATDPHAQMEAIESRLTGYEFDPFAAWMSHVFLESALTDLMRRANRRLAPIVQVRDSLAEPENPSRFDLVIGNPPYGRKRLTTEERQAYARSLHGHANLYGLFTDLALRLAAPSGVISFVTPTSFLSGQYFSSLRGLLTAIARPNAIEFISDRKGVFDDVLQETVLAAFRLGSNDSRTTTRYLVPSQIGELAVVDGGRHTVPTHSEAPWFLPRDSNLTIISKRLASLPARLSDYGYKVSTGPLVWNRHKPQLTNEHGANCYPVIWAESVTRSGGFELRAQKRNHKRFLAATFPRDEWLITHSGCVLVQRTTAKEQTRRIVAAPLPQDVINLYGGAVVENHLNMIVPITDTPLVPADLLAAMLNSETIDLAFRCINGSVAVSAFELNALPLPDVRWVREHLPMALHEEHPSDADTLIAEHCLSV